MENRHVRADSERLLGLTLDGWTSLSGI